MKRLRGKHICKHTSVHLISNSVKLANDKGYRLNQSWPLQTYLTTLVNYDSKLIINFIYFYDLIQLGTVGLSSGAKDESQHQDKENSYII